MKVNRRNLDGIYFRIERNGEYVNLCFSDLTEEERSKVMEGRSEEWLKHLANHLADCLSKIGEQFDIRG